MKTVLSIMLAALLCALLQACGGDIASPFDKPDETVEPVTQGEHSK
jgi:hypothetical protein